MPTAAASDEVPDFGHWNGIRVERPTCWRTSTAIAIAERYLNPPDLVEEVILFRAEVGKTPLNNLAWEERFCLWLRLTDRIVLLDRLPLTSAGHEARAQEVDYIRDLVRKSGVPMRHELTLLPSTHQMAVSAALDTLDRPLGGLA